MSHNDSQWRPLSHVVIGVGLLTSFLDAAIARYQACTPAKPPSWFAVLIGAISDDSATVERLEYGANARATSEVAVNEFASGIVPAFGPAYRNEHRGYWCDSADLLRIHRDAEADGYSILGSVHMHPDWHRIGPPGERALRISERPTPMDEYMFAMTGWAVNMICYLERSGSDICHRYAAWQYPPGHLTWARPAAIPMPIHRSAITEPAGCGR